RSAPASAASPPLRPAGSTCSRSIAGTTSTCRRPRRGPTPPAPTIRGWRRCSPCCSRCCSPTSRCSAGTADRSASGWCGEAGALARALEAHDLLALAEGLGVDGETPAVAAMRLHGMEQDRLAGEEGAHQRLGIAAAPQVLLGQRAAQRPPEQPPH